MYFHIKIVAIKFAYIHIVDSQDILIEAGAHKSNIYLLTGKLFKRHGVSLPK